MSLYKNLLSHASPHFIRVGIRSPNFLYRQKGMIVDINVDVSYCQKKSMLIIINKVNAHHRHSVNFHCCQQNYFTPLTQILNPPLLIRSMPTHPS